jgi:hypothetical protein
MHTRQPILELFFETLLCFGFVPLCGVLQIDELVLCISELPTRSVSIMLQCLWIRRTQSLCEVRGVVVRVRRDGLRLAHRPDRPTDSIALTRRQERQHATHTHQKDLSESNVCIPIGLETPIWHASLCKTRRSLSRRFLPFVHTVPLLVCSEIILATFGSSTWVRDRHVNLAKSLELSQFGFVILKVPVIGKDGTATRLAVGCDCSNAVHPRIR